MFPSTETTNGRLFLARDWRESNPIVLRLCIFLQRQTETELV